MGLMHLICWTSDHFIKKHRIFRREARFSRVRIFEIFENLDFWTFYHCILYSFLPGFPLWQRGLDSTKQMMVYDQITFFINCFLIFYFVEVQKIWGNIAKSTENANLPRIPRIYVEGHTA